MLFCGRYLTFVLQTLTKLLLHKMWGCLCTCNTVQSISDVAMLQWTEYTFPQSHKRALLENVQYQRAVSVRSMCHACTENTIVTFEACWVHLQRAEPRISRLGNAKLLTQNYSQALWGTGQFAPESIFTSPTAADLGTWVWERLAVWEHVWEHIS